MCSFLLPEALDYTYIFNVEISDYHVRFKLSPLPSSLHVPSQTSYGTKLHIFNPTQSVFVHFDLKKSANH